MCNEVAKEMFAYIYLLMKVDNKIPLKIGITYVHAHAQTIMDVNISEHLSLKPNIDN
jgi:hypothetical protein